MTKRVLSVNHTRILSEFSIIKGLIQIRTAAFAGRCASSPCTAISCGDEIEQTQDIVVFIFLRFVVPIQNYA